MSRLHVLLGVAFLVVAVAIPFAAVGLHDHAAEPAMMGCGTGGGARAHIVETASAPATREPAHSPTRDEKA
jgi:hypothetical protein